MQEQLRSRVRAADDFGEVTCIGALDISYDRRSPVLFAAAVVTDPRGELLERVAVRAEASFPYVPGYLSFRECPAAFAALDRMEAQPDLLLCDGQGLAHPRRFGLACHVGVLRDLPTIGCAKSRLVGTHREPSPRRGAHVRLRDAGETIGEVVRTRDGVRPVFVSVGHRVSLPTARRWVLRLARRYRVPEPIRLAHATCNAARRGEIEAAPISGRTRTGTRARPSPRPDAPRRGTRRAPASSPGS